MLFNQSLFLCQSNPFLLNCSLVNPQLLKYAERFNDAVKTFFFNMNFSPKFSTTPQEGKGFRQFKENWKNNPNYCGHQVFKSTPTYINKDIDYVRFNSKEVFWNFTNELKGYNLSIYNISGQKVFESYELPTNNKQIVNYSNFDKGTYFMIIQNGRDIKTYKMVN